MSNDRERIYEKDEHGCLFLLPDEEDINDLRVVKGIQNYANNRVKNNTAYNENVYISTTNRIIFTSFCCLANLYASFTMCCKKQL